MERREMGSSCGTNLKHGSCQSLLYKEKWNEKSKTFLKLYFSSPSIYNNMSNYINDEPGRNFINFPVFFQASDNNEIGLKIPHWRKTLCEEFELKTNYGKCIWYHFSCSALVCFKLRQTMERCDGKISLHKLFMVVVCSSSYFAKIGNNKKSF